MEPVIKPAPVVLLHGGSAGADVNLGDQLMLREAIDRTQRAFPRFGLAAAPTIGPFEDRAELRLRQYLRRTPKRRLSGLVGYPVISRYRHTFGIVTDRDLGVVLNFMGYRYFDVGCKETRIDAAEVRAWSELNIPTILLPQAYGPFSSQAIKDNARELFQSSRLVYARDSHSAGLVASLGIARPEVVPDITIAAHAGTNSRPDLRDMVCIVPNRWMVERVREEEGSAYIEFLASLVKYLQSTGLKSFVLCHAAFQDYPLAQKIAESCEGELEVVVESDARIAKAIVGASKLVVGSRYHGLIAALSQNVPVVATSWAHKYEFLLADYGCPEVLVRPTDLPAAVSVARELLDQKGLRSFQDRTAEFNKDATARIERMWEQVFEVFHEIEN